MVVNALGITTNRRTLACLSATHIGVPMATNCDYQFDINNLTHEDTFALVYLPNEWFVYEILWPLLLAFVLLTNVSFIFVVYRSPQLRTQTYAYLVNLSIFDLMFVISNTSNRMIQYISSPLRNDDTLVGLTGCVIFGYIEGMCYAGSSTFVTLVSFERYLAICYPIYHHLVKGEKRTVKLICASWIYSMLIGLWIVFLYTDVYSTCIVWPADQKYGIYPSTSLSCAPMSVIVADVIYVILFALWVGLPLSNAFMYYRIMKTLKKRNLSGMELGTSASESEQSRQVATMLVANGTVFYSCCMVMEIMLLISFLQRKSILVLDGFTQIATHYIFYFIFALNCCINPIVYGLTNNRYRQIFLRVMKNLIYKTSNKNSSTTQVDDTRM